VITCVVRVACCHARACCRWSPGGQLAGNHANVLRPRRTVHDVDALVQHSVVRELRRPATGLAHRPHRLRRQGVVMQRNCVVACT
jgi:hypothetical protein